MNAPIIALVLLLAANTATPKPAPTHAPDAIARGRYLVGFSCNDCHTPRWRESDGTIPVSEWLTGSQTGYRGPWGTIYPPNLRLEFSQMSESQWLFMTRTRGGRYPMVWQDIRMMTEDDRRAIYAFIRSLGAKGAPAHASLPPWVEPETPFFFVMPSTPKPRG